jgi:hypothetical protein
MWSKIKYYVEMLNFLYYKQSFVIRYSIVFILVITFINLLIFLNKNVNFEFLSTSKIIKVENYVIKSKDENLKINDINKINDNWKLPNEEEINLIYKYRYEIPELDKNGNYLFINDGYSTYFIKSFSTSKKSMIKKDIEYKIRLLKLYSDNQKVDIVVDKKVDDIPKVIEEIGCVGFGNESCIDRVRENFINSGNIILGEEYLDNGQFGISFLDPSRGQSYNSKVSTDCNCKIINVVVSVMR